MSFYLFEDTKKMRHESNTAQINLQTIEERKKTKKNTKIKQRQVHQLF